MAESNRVIVLNEGSSAAVIESGTAAARACTPPKTMISREWHVLYVAEGEGWLRAPTFAGRVGPGTLISVPPGRAEYELRDGRLTMLSMREPATARTSVPFSFPLVRPLSRFEERRWRERIDASAHRIATDAFDDGDARELRDDLAHLAFSPDAPAHATFVSTLHAMWERLDQPLRLRQVAADHGYTANYLNDLSRLHSGRSLGRWLSDMRMSRARELLAESDRPIAEIGAAVGHDDPAYFSRVFRRIHGVTPLAWRITHRPHDPRHRGLVSTFDEMKHGAAEVAERRRPLALTP